ncbi:MAG: Filamentous hemagglutinin family outer membrane protein, partial [Parcubacteria group bacterium GW2011_GWC1_39_29]
MHWVNTSGAQAVADDSNFFKKVFVINQTEFNWYNKGSDYTSVNQVPNYARVPGSTPTPVAGNLSVSLASDTPGATTVTTNAQGVNYLKFRLSGTGTVNTITIKRTSAGSVNDFDNVYLYEGAKRLVDGKSLTSSTGEVTFNMGSFTVSGTRDLTVVGDLSATAGNVDSFQVTAMGLYAGSVSGLPISGNNITVSGAVSGTLTQTKVGSIASPNAGAANVQLSEFKLAADTEAAS